MKLNEALYELHGYVKAVSDQGRNMEELKHFIEEGKKPNSYPSLPDTSQWYRICKDLDTILDGIEKSNK